VGVTDLINQWVKGNSDVNTKSPSSKAAVSLHGSLNVNRIVSYSESY